MVSHVVLHLGRNISSYGMPSSHSQFISFFSSYLILHFLFLKPIESYKRFFYCLVLVMVKLFIAYIITRFPKFLSV
ncbi:hypothetical protein MXB_4416 [Myxobolus squamalis]|nr:hypothetical protein MXB_4416 [Myxobolus squamalis]